MYTDLFNLPGYLLKIFIKKVVYPILSRGEYNEALDKYLTLVGDNFFMHIILSGIFIIVVIVPVYVIKYSYHYGFRIKTPEYRKDIIRYNTIIEKLHNYGKAKYEKYHLGKEAMQHRSAIDKLGDLNDD